MNQDYINKALKTWYAPNHPLYLNPLHPALGLAGEVGEVLNLYKKNEYKPGFSWWDCKYCGESSDWHGKTNSRCRKIDNHWAETIYTPLILDELGDVSYYLRILMFQIKYIPNDFSIDKVDLLQSLISLNSDAALILEIIRDTNNWSGTLWFATNAFYQICEYLEVTPEYVMDMNYEKLSKGDNHGWKDAK